MIALSKRVTFTPTWRQADPEGPKYILRVGNVLERAAFEAELAGEHRAGEVAPWDVTLALAEGIATILTEATDRDHILELVQAEDENLLPPEDRQLLKEVTQIVGEHWPAYRSLVAQKERRKQVLPILAFRRFCVGWENIDVPFTTSADGMVALEALAQINPMEMKAAGIRAFNLLYGSGEAGNSARPSKSDEGQQTSDSDAPSPAAGKSPGKPGKKTRASRSPNGSSQSSTSG